MPAGPIATAFVEIIAKLSFEEGGKIEDALGVQLKAVEKQMKRIESVASEAANKIREDFSNLEVQVNTRLALSQIRKLEGSITSIAEELNKLKAKELNIKTGPLSSQVTRVQNALSKLSEDFTLVDGKELHINVASARANLTTMKNAVDGVTKALDKIPDAALHIDMKAVTGQIQSLKDRIASILKDLSKLGNGEVIVDVNALGADKLEADLKGIFAEVEKLTGKQVSVVVNTDGTERVKDELIGVEQAAEHAKAVAAGLVKDLTASLNPQIISGLQEGLAKAEEQFKKLKGVGTNTAKAIEAAFAEIRAGIDTQSAIIGMRALSEQVDGVATKLREVSGQTLSIETGKFRTNIDSLVNSIANLQRDIKEVDGEGIDINVSKIEERIKVIQEAIKRLVTTLNTAANKDVNLDVAPALGQLKLLREKVNAAFKDFQTLGRGEVHVDVNTEELDRLDEKLKETQRQIAKASGVIHLNTSGAVDEANTLSARVGNVGDTFERVGKRLLAFAVFGGITAGISQLISAGIQAAAQIETIEVSLDRLFKGFSALGKQLGGTSTEFLAQLKKLAIETPFQFADLGDVSTKLLQLNTDLTKVADSTGKLPSRADIAIDRMKALADAAGGVGATADDINGVVRAISQLQAKGRINLQDLNQIAERLPNFQRSFQIEAIIEQLNKVRPNLKATVADFDQLRKDGLIPVNVAVDGLFAGLEKIPGAAGAAAAQARTLTGALSNLKDFATVEFADAFSNAGAQIATALNDSFRGADFKTPLAKAIEDVIGSAGIAVERALPHVLDFVDRIADKIAAGVTALGQLASGLASGFGADLFSGVVSGLTNIINLLNQVNAALNLLPAGVGEAVGQFLTLNVAISQISGGKINVFGIIVDQLKNIRFTVKALRLEFITLKDAIESLETSTVILAAIALAFGVFETITGDLAGQARASEQYATSINDATKSLRDFKDVGSAAVDFLNKFKDAGQGIKTGSGSDLIKSLTSTDLSTNLHVTTEQLGKLVEKMAEGEDEFAALSDLHVDISGIDDAGQSLINLKNLADQFGKGAKNAFNEAVAQKTFEFVSPKDLQDVKDLTESTGTYALGLKQLNDLNKAGAKVRFELEAATDGLSASQQTLLLRQSRGKDGVVDYEVAVGNLREKMTKLNDSFDDFVSTNKAVENTFTALTSGAGTARSRLLDFAAVADFAGASVEQLEALSIKLGTSLSGEELGAAFKNIANDWKSLLDTLTSSLPPFSDAVTATFKDIKIPDGVTGLDAVQSAFDQFSLDKFIHELNRIVDARANMIFNLTKLAGQSTQAVRKLFELKLDPTQLAVAAQSLAEGGQTAIDAFLEPFNRSDKLVQGAGYDLIRTLVEAGIDPALLKAIPGLSDSVGSAVDAALNGAVVTSTGPNDALSNLETRLSGLGDKGIDGLSNLEKRLSTLGQGGGIDALSNLESRLSGLGTPADGGVGPDGVPNLLRAPAAPVVPGIDVPAATQSASSAGAAVSDAFSTAVSNGLNAFFVSFSGQVTAGIANVGPAAGLSAQAVGSVITTGLTLGVQNGLSTLGPAIVSSLDAIFPPATFRAVAFGTDVGTKMGKAVVTAVNEGLKELPGIFSQFGGQLEASLGSLTAIFEIFINDLAGKAVDSATRFQGAGSLMGVSLANAFQIELEGMQPQTEAALNALVASLANYSTAFYNSGFSIGAALGRGLVDGIYSLIPAIRAAANAAAQTATQETRRVTGVSSPSKVFMEIGRNLMQGLAIGITKNSVLAARAAASAIGDMPAGRGSTVGSLAPASLSSPGRSSSDIMAALTLAAPVVAAGATHNHEWNVTVPTDDPEAFSRRAAVRLERRIRR